MSKEEASSWRREQQWEQNCDLLEEGNVSNMFLNSNCPAEGTEGSTPYVNMSPIRSLCHSYILPSGYVGPTNTSFDDDTIRDAINTY
eukprot:3795511-Ditylum_brightwellii.AAC.1